MDVAGNDHGIRDVAQSGGGGGGWVGVNVLHLGDKVSV